MGNRMIATGGYNDRPAEVFVHCVAMRAMTGRFARTVGSCMSNSLEPQTTQNSYDIVVLSVNMSIKVSVPSSHLMSQQFWLGQLGGSWILMNVPLTTCVLPVF